MENSFIIKKGGILILLIMRFFLRVCEHVGSSKFIITHVRQSTLFRLGRMPWSVIDVNYAHCLVMRLGGTGCSCMCVSYRTTRTCSHVLACLTHGNLSSVMAGKEIKNEFEESAWLVCVGICAGISVARVCDHWIAIIAVDYTCHIHAIQACTSCTRCVNRRAALWRKCNDIDRWFTKQWRAIRRRWIRR